MTINISDIPDPIPMTPAMEKHFSREEIAVINDSICVRNGIPCEYAQNKIIKNSNNEETCAFKNAMDDFLYGSLKSGLILHINIAHCDHYTSTGNDIESLSRHMISMKDE